jgi:hypothetical protein
VKAKKAVAKKATVKANSVTTKKEQAGVSMKAATRVGKRNWSLDKFTEAVKKRCKRMGVPFVQSRVDSCYDEGVTIPDTVRVMRG